VGGIVIALLSFLVERADKKIAGIILSLPSTAVISYIFIAWTISPEAVGAIAPASLATCGSTIIFTTVYIYLAKIKLSKIKSICLSLIGALLVWFLLSVPLAVYKLDNIIIGFLLYFITICIAYYFLTIKNQEQKSSDLLTYTTSQKIGRAIIAGLIISLSVFLSKIINPFWGGIFSGFPAAFSSTFLILHWYYGSHMLFKVAKTMPIGSLVYIPFIIASHWTYPAFGIFGGTIFAYFFALVAFFALIKLQNKKHLS